jgi:hypothetical protein
VPIRLSDVPAKTRDERRQPTTPTASSPVIELVVRRGALRRFDKLKTKTADLQVKVSWDRRQDDRRTSSHPSRTERRKTERRQKPPFTWDVADFVVVERQPGRTGQTNRKKKS